MMTRSYVTTAYLRQLATDLTEHDWEILRSLRTVRIATGRQLEGLHFVHADPRQRRRSLARLVERRLVATLARRVGGVRAGSSGLVYVLDVAGLRLLNATTSRPQRPWTPGHAFVAHALAVTELYVQLVEARRNGRAEVFDFRAEPQSWRTFSGPGGGRVTLKPDAYVCTATARLERHWFIEVDCGTESLSAITRKLVAYRRYWASGREQARIGLFPWVLFLVSNEGRGAQIESTIASQPGESQRLFRAGLHEDAAEVLVGGGT